MPGLAREVRKKWTWARTYDIARSTSNQHIGVPTIGSNGMSSHHTHALCLSRLRISMPVGPTPGTSLAKRPIPKGYFLVNWNVCQL